METGTMHTSPDGPLSATPTVASSDGRVAGVAGQHRAQTQPWDGLSPVWRRGLIVALVLLYIAAAAASARFVTNETDLDAFFFPSARIALSGHPFDVYSLRYQLIYANANGPLGLVPLTLAAWLARAAGWLDDPLMRRAVVNAVFAPFTLLLAWEVVTAADRIRGAALRGPGRVVAFALVPLGPNLWHAMLLYGHVEQPMMLWLVLLSTRLLTTGVAHDDDGASGRWTRRAAWAGALCGLALLARTAAIVYLVVLALVALRARGWRAALAFGGAAVAVVALGLAPLLLWARDDTLYSLVTFRTHLIVGGGSLWGLAVGTPLADVGHDHDSQVLLVALVLAVGALLLVRRRMPGAQSGTFARRDIRAVYALLAVASFFFPLFIKSAWPYYFLDPYVFLVVWWLGGTPLWGAARAQWVRWAALVLVPAWTVLCAQVCEVGVARIYEESFVRQWSAWASGVTLLAVAALAGWLMWDGRARGRA